MSVEPGNAIPRVSIVVPVYNGATLTKGCLDAIIEQRLPAEIIVVDDGSTDSTALLLATYGDRIRVLSNEVNLGYGESCNRGAAAATGSMLMLLNNDTVPAPGWLGAMLDCLDEHPEAAIVGAKMLYPNGLIQHAGVAFNEDGMPFHLYAGLPGNHPATASERTFQAVTAACMLIRRSVFDKLRGFDTGFINAFEDIDLCLRAGESGHQVRYCPSAVVVHLESATRGRDPQRQSELLFVQRWAHRVHRDELDHLRDDGLLQVSHTHNHRVIIGIDPTIGRMRDVDPLAAETVIDEVTARWMAGIAEREGLLAKQRAKSPVRFAVESDGRINTSSAPVDWRDESLEEVWPRAEALRARCAPMRLDLRPAQPARVNVLVDSLTAGRESGAGKTVAQLVSALSGAGLLVRIVGLDPSVTAGSTYARACTDGAGADSTAADVQFQDASHRGAPVAVSPTDRFIATNCWTMHIAHLAAEQLSAPPPLWLIDEYEPLDLPAGAFAATARAAYHLPHAALISSDSLGRYLESHRLGCYAHGYPSHVFRAPLSAGPPPTAGDLDRPGPRRILVNVPPQPAALSEMVLAGLDLARRRGLIPDGWYVTGIGGQFPGNRRQTLPSGLVVENLERVPPSRYPALLHSHDVGVALLDGPRISRVALDLAAAGLVTVTSTFHGRSADQLQAVSPNLVGTEPDPPSIAEAIGSAVRRAEDLPARSAGAGFDWPRTTGEVFDQAFVDEVVALLGGCRPATHLPS